jgi:hypothetical protein
MWDTRASWVTTTIVFLNSWLRRRNRSRTGKSARKRFHGSGPRPLMNLRFPMVAEYRYPDVNIPFEIKRRTEYYYLIRLEPLRWRNPSLPCNMWTMTLGAGSSAPTAGRDSSVSLRGKNTLPITRGDPNGSPPAFVPVGRGKSFGLARALWRTTQVAWLSRLFRIRHGSRGFPPDTNANPSRAAGLKPTL